MDIRKSLLFCAGLLLGQVAWSQVILSDPTEEPLFAVPTTMENISFSLSKLELKVPFAPFGGLQHYVMVDGVRVNTMTKSWSFFGKMGLVENSDDVLIFSKDTKLGISGEFGIMNTVDKLQDPARKGGMFFTFELAATLKQQRFDTYDKAVLSMAGYNRLAPGVRAGLNLFRRDRFALAFNGSWQHRADVEGLTDFQKLGPDFFMDANIASNGDKDGYIGPVSPVHQFRWAVATPIYAFPAFGFGGEGLRKLQPVLTPYYFMTANRMRNAVHNAGIGLSLLTQRIFGGKDTSFSDAISLGYNLVKSSDRSNARFLFVSGTFSFGNFSKPDKEKQEGKKAVPIR